MADNKKIWGYVPLTCHNNESAKLHNKPLAPYYKTLSLEERIKRHKQTFGMKKDGKLV